MDAAARIPVVVIQHHCEGLPSSGRGAASGSSAPEFALRPRDLLIRKSLPGSFTNTPLKEWLRGRGITTVSIAGCMSHMCRDTTARQAVHRASKSEFLSDATGKPPPSKAGGTVTAEELRRAILAAQARFVSEVLPSSEGPERL
jgi:nicotinamidase-related amidase